MLDGRPKVFGAGQIRNGKRQGCPWRNRLPSETPAALRYDTGQSIHWIGAEPAFPSP